MTREVEVGGLYLGKVTRIMGFGAFVEILPGKEGLVRIGELADYHVPTVEDVVSVGDEIMVVVTRSTARVASTCRARRRCSATWPRQTLSLIDQKVQHRKTVRRKAGRFPFDAARSRREGVEPFGRGRRQIGVCLDPRQAAERNDFAKRGEVHAGGERRRTIAARTCQRSSSLRISASTDHGGRPGARCVQLARSGQLFGDHGELISIEPRVPAADRGARAVATSSWVVTESCPELWAARGRER